MINAINSILTTIIWPIVCLVIIYTLKSPISNLIRRITKIGYDKAGIIAESSNLQSENKENNPIERLSKGSTNENIDNFLSLFNPLTITEYENAVKKETNLDNYTTPEEREYVLFRYSQAIYLIMHFNKIYELIFGSQIKLLQVLNGSLRENSNSLKRFYDTARDKYFTTYDNYSYEQYLSFLFNYRLIMQESDGNIKITILGRDFIKYIVETGLSTEKSN